MSVLELAEFFAAERAKPKRSMLFIWHVGEEEGLFGSEYFTDHPEGKKQVMGRVAGQMISLIYALLKRDQEVLRSTPPGNSHCAGPAPGNSGTNRCTKVAGAARPDAALSQARNALV